MIDKKAFFATINDRGSLTLPAPIREQLQIEPGTLLRLSVTSDDKLLIEVGEFSTRTSSEAPTVAKPPLPTAEQFGKSLKEAKRRNAKTPVTKEPNVE